MAIQLLTSIRCLCAHTRTCLMRWYGTTRRGQDVTIKFLRVRSLRQDRGNTYKHQTKSPRGDEPRYYLCNVSAYEYIYTHRNTADGVRSAKGDDAQPGDTISSYMHVKVRICQFQRPQQICLLRRVNDASYLAKGFMVGRDTLSSFWAMTTYYAHR